MPPILQKMFKRETVLIAFLVAKAVHGLVVGLTVNTSEAWGNGILAVLVYGVISWFAHKGQGISIWAISLIMMFEGTSQFGSAWKGFDANPAVSSMVFVVATYIVLGAMVIFLNRRREA